MLSRISHVQQLKITSLSLSSVTQIGDSKMINGLSRALAVQREDEIFFTHEGDYSLYPIFSEHIPLPLIREDIHFQKINLQPCIRVPHIKINGVSTSSVVHIGNSEKIYMESRVKHIRHLKDED